MADRELKIPRVAGAAPSRAEVAEHRHDVKIRSPRVLVATRRFEVRHRTCAQLADLGCAVVGETGGASIESIATYFHPDLAVLDLEDEPGCRTPLAVIWLPNPTSTADQVAAAWRAGAVDVVPDPTDIDDVVRRIGTALGLADGDRLAVGDLTIDVAGHVAHRDRRELDLTPTEFRLLVALVSNAGVVMSKPQLLRAVWGFDDYDVNLVEVHVSALRRKLEDQGGGLIHTVRGIGYVLRSSPPRYRRIERWGTRAVV